MIIVAVDTSTSFGSVALLDGAETRAEARFTARGSHSCQVLPALDFVLRAGGLGPLEIEGFAVAAGPGSFTGLRVGISTVQGLALATGRPCLGVSVFDATAAAADGVGPLVCLRDAFRAGVYSAVYDAEGHPVGPAAVGPIDAALARVPAGAAFVGDVVLAHREEIAARVPGARFPGLDPFLAAAVGRWAEPRLRAGEGHGPEALRPLYLRGADTRMAAA